MEDGKDYGDPETITALDGSNSVISAVPRKNTFLEELVALCTLLTLFGLVYACVLLVLIILTTALLFSSKAAIIALLIAVALMLLPDGQVWRAYKRLSLWSMLRRHFSCRLVTPPKANFLQQHGQYLFAEFPHAVYPLGSFLFNFRGCDITATGIPPSAGCFPADYKPMLAYLQQPGACLSIIPEGFAGIFVASDASTETIFLSQRKGFIKLALQSGADLVPMYHLGQSQLLDF
ncbi:g10603 [Coccomyxa elongata]